MNTETCEKCDKPAAHENSVPDRNAPGYTLNECGYRRQLLCIAHAVEAAQDSCSRVRVLPNKTCECCCWRNHGGLGTCSKDNEPASSGDTCELHQPRESAGKAVAQ